MPNENDEVYNHLEVVAEREKKAKNKGSGRKPLPESKCLTPGCQRMFGGNQEKKGGRGLCYHCHQASLLIKREETTWEELEGYGLAQPKYGSIVEHALIEARRNKMKQEEQQHNED